MRGQEKIANRNLLERHNKCSFPQRSLDTWNVLKEGDNGKKSITTKGKKLDKYRYREMTTCVAQALYTTTRVKYKIQIYWIETKELDYV